MKMKIRIISIVFCLLITAAVFSQEGAAAANSETAAVIVENSGEDKLDTYYPVRGLENWNYYYDLSPYKEGTYNLIIQGIDKSGNIYEEGPINIYLDPDSDIPVASINNPTPEMRVGGSNLNVAGTCVDDDAVSYVEVKIDEGPFLRAEGTEFWSCYLSTGDLRDGRHVITARGVDINGTAGEPVSRAFNLDTIKPLNTITSHENGVLVSGRVKIEGISTDLNGVEKLFLSTDGGKIFEPLKISYDKKEDLYRFNRSINTKALEDGPQIYWFKSIDKTGSTGYSAFLFFVDNTDPELTILSPASDQMVNGKVTVCGKVSDEIGISSLSYVFDKETGEIPLIPGNPYWVKEFDFLPVKGKSTQVTFTVEDVTGNITTEKVKFLLDKEGDLPRLSLISPENDSLVEGEVLVSGFVTDDDGVRELSYTLDSMAPVTLELSEAFSFFLPDVKPGKHKFTIKCLDINGLAGDETRIEFTKAGSTPGITINTLVQNNTEQSFYPGIEVLRDSRPVLIGQVNIEDKILSAEYRFKENEFGKLNIKRSQAGVSEFEIPLDTTVDFGVNTLDIRITDEYERITGFTSFIYLKNYTRINDQPGLYFSDARLSNGKIRISKNDPLSFLFVGDEIKSVTLEPATDLVRTVRSGRLIKVLPAAAGVTPKTRIKVRTEYDEIFFSGDLIFITDQEGPAVTLKTPSTGDWVNREVTVSGTVTDASGIASLEYSLDNRLSFTELQPGNNRTALDFNQSLSLASREDGNLVIFIKAVDQADNITLTAVSLDKDTVQPEITILAPAVTDKTRETLLIMGQVQDAGKVKTIEFSEDGKTYQKLGSTGFFQHKLNLGGNSASPARFFIRCTDFSGNTAAAEINSKQDNSDSPFLASGSANHDFSSDSSRVKSSGVKVTLSGSDSNKDLHYETSFSKALNATPPLTPFDHRQDILVSGSLKLQGTFDPGLEAMQLFFGAGNLFNPVKFSLDKKTNLYTFTLSLATREMQDGEQVYWIQCVDTAGTNYFAPFTFYLDNTLPQIQILAPAVGKQINGSVTIAGSVTDNTNVRSLFFSMGRESEEIVLNPDNPYFSKSLDLTGISGSSLNFSLTAEDLCGNKFSLNHKISIDKNSDLPGVVITYPLQDSQLEDSRVSVYGSAADDDGIQSIRYRLDKGEPVELSTNGAFSFKLTGLEPGSHTLEVTPFDINGTPGPGREVDFVYTGVMPELSLTGINAPSGTLDWEMGCLVPDDSGKSVLLGECSLNITSADYAFFDREPRKLTVKSSKNQPGSAFEIALPQDLPYGRVDFTIRVRDTFEREQVFTAFYYKIAEDDPAAIIDAEGIYLADSVILEKDLFLPQNRTFTGFFNGREIREISLEPAAGFLKPVFKDKQIQITPIMDGISEQSKIKIVTVHGREFYSPPFRFYADHQSPVLEITSPLTGDWVQDQVTVAGKALDNLAVTSLRYSLDKGVTFKELSFQETTAGVEFTAAIPLAGQEDGDINLLLEAGDRTGNRTLHRVSFKKDTRPAAITMITPLAGDTVNGKITVVGSATDTGRLDRVEFSDDDVSFKTVAGTALFYFDLDFAVYSQLPEKFILKAFDKSGNTGQLNPVFKVDTEIDKPVAAIQVPEKAAVLKNDFVISGMVFDDDAVGIIHYKLDDEEPRSLEGSNNFEIPVKLEEITDNEHTITVWAEDIGGVTGDPVQSTFIISRAEPIAVLKSPELENTLKDKIILTGEASDENGIKAVYISFDNGNTYNMAAGREEWSYTLDTNLIKDGTHSVFIKAVDYTDTEGISASLINIDNTPPEIILDFPADGDILSENILFDGRAFDNVFLAELTASLIPLDAENSTDVKIYDLPTEGIFSQMDSLAGLSPGWYDVRLQARDRADNLYYVSRNIVVREMVNVDDIEILFPTDGADLGVYFTVSGKVESSSKVENVIIYLDDKPVEVVDVNADGFYKLDFGTGETEGEIKITAGSHRLRAEATLEGDQVLTSGTRNISYRDRGGFVKITNLDVGAFITERPWLQGIAGYYPGEVDKSDADAYKAFQAEMKENEIQLVEVSLDNGKTFHRARGKEKWRYRLETQSIPDGNLRIIVRAVYNNQSVVTKTILTVDDTPPVVKLLSPEEGRRFNDELSIIGTASDKNGMEGVYINLRQGDKFKHSLPSFVQGFYIDAHFLGATEWEVGAGLTFFDQNVKFQFNLGNTPSRREGSDLMERFYGMSVGFKLLANIADIPFSFFFGPDWEIFSMCFALGAHFSYFSMVPDAFKFYDAEIPYVILGAVLAQFEFAKFKFNIGIKDKSGLNINTSYFPLSVSTYAEMSVWFISSDVLPLLLPKISFGARLGL